MGACRKPVFERCGLFRKFLIEESDIFRLKSINSRDKRVELFQSFLRRVPKDILDKFHTILINRHHQIHTSEKDHGYQIRSRLSFGCFTTSSDERVKNADFAQRPSDLKFTTAGR